jgi:hypothetical protein
MNETTPPAGRLHALRAKHHKRVPHILAKDESDHGPQSLDPALGK